MTRAIRARRRFPSRARSALGLGGIALATGAVFAGACGEPFETCEDTRSCGSVEAGAGGEAGGAIGGAAGAIDEPGGGGGQGGEGGEAVEPPGGAAGEGGAGAQGGDESTGGEPEVSGAAGQGGAGEMPCDPAGSPIDQQCLVNDETAIFVAPEGDDSDPGTAEAPLATLGEAIERAQDSDKIVIACAGIYRENLELGGASPVRFYGGFICEGGWRPGSARSILQPDQGIPLRIVSATGSIEIEGLEPRAPDAESPGESSIAAMVVNADSVRFRRVRFAAGDGADGANGNEAGFEHAARAPAGNPASGSEPGGARSCECPAGDGSTGAKGGVGGTTPGSGNTGLPDLGGGAGGDSGAASCDLGRGGEPGAAGDLVDPAPGATSRGSLSASGFAPSAGQHGADGSTGQGGGGGGGGASIDGGAGGGGGCGGCGGKGGAPGKGGGASIALLVFQSSVELSDAQLVTADGGAGGDGQAGEPGQSGGNGGMPSSPGCAGGTGGTGARGGAGGGGAGGLNAGVLYRGTAPEIDSTVTYNLGEPGPGGRGGEPGENDGDEQAMADEVLTL